MFDSNGDQIASATAPIAAPPAGPHQQRPGYYFSAYPNLAFGGSLSLLANHQAAWNSNPRFYKLSISSDVTGVSRAITSSFTDLRRNATASPPRFEPLVTGVLPGAEPVRPSTIHISRNTALPDHGHNRLELEFFDTNKAPIAGYTRLIYVDTTRSSVSLTYLRRGTATVRPAPDAYSVPEACGLTAYNTKDDLGLPKSQLH